MLLFLFSLFTLEPHQAFKHYTKSGKQDYCLVDYAKKTVSCEYKTLKDCRDTYADHRSSLCFERKRLKLEGDTE
jgi:hypothetical protein